MIFKNPQKKLPSNEKTKWKYVQDTKQEKTDSSNADKEKASGFPFDIYWGNYCVLNRT